MQSYQAWRLIETGSYRYDPSEHHGPLLYYVTQWLQPLVADESGKLTDAGMRHVPLLFSVATLFLGLVAFRRYGSGTALLWGLIFAAAPLCVIYGSYYVQEALLACFTLAFALAVFRYWQSPSWLAASTVGLSLGLMHVTKETVALHVLAIGLAGVAVAWIRKEGSKLPCRTGLKHAVLALGLVVGLHCLFFSSFFENPRGIVDGVTAFFHYAERSQGQGHEKPFFYYLSFLLPQTLEGVRWGELAFVLAVVVGLARSLLGVKQNGFAAFVASSGLLMFVLYSIIPYKNPWLLLSPYTFLAYAAAYGVVGLFRMGFFEPNVLGRWSLHAAGLALLLFLALELRSNLEKAVFQYASASRNPYLYMHTTPRYAMLLAKLRPLAGREPISIYSPDASWPLPWHLRGQERVGYWKDLDSFRPNGIDIVDTRLLVGHEEVMSDGAFWELQGLRPNTLLAVRASDAIARTWIENNAKD